MEEGYGREKHPVSHQPERKERGGKVGEGRRKGKGRENEPWLYSSGVLDFYFPKFRRKKA